MTLVISSFRWRSLRMEDSRYPNLLLMTEKAVSAEDLA